LIHRSPQTFGLERSWWWFAGLREVSPWLTLPAIHKLLHRLNITYKRGRDYVHSPDPFYDLKLAYIQRAQSMVKAEPQHYLLLYQDELTYYRSPTMAKAYAMVGNKHPLAYMGYSANRKRGITACLNPQTGELFAQQRSRFTVQTLLKFYQSLEVAYPHYQWIFIVLDNWPVHFHPTISLALQKSRIVLLRLPTYAPWTNPIEQVWRKLQHDLLHLHRFEDDGLGLQAAVQLWLNQWHKPSPKLLRYVGLTPD
jgi:transposase